MYSKSKLKRINILFAGFCLYWIALAAFLVYLNLHPVSPAEDLVKVSGPVQSVYYYTLVHSSAELSIRLKNYPSTEFWTDVNVHELNQTLYAGEEVQFLVNHDFTESTQQEEIKQVSANDITLSSYKDWVTSEENRHKWTWVFLPVAVLIAAFFGYMAFWKTKKNRI